MLIPFIIDPEALIQFGADDVDPYVATMLHRSVLNLWERSGVLLIDGGDFNKSKMKDSIDKLEYRYRNMWITALGSGNFAKDYVPEWGGEATPESIAVIRDRVSLVIIDFSKAIEFGLDENSYEKEFNKTVTVCRSGALSQTRLLSRNELLANQHIKKDTLIEDVWESRFRSIIEANHVHDLFIVDRYAISQLFLNGDLKRGHNLSGLQRFFVWITKSAKSKKSITLYASDKDFRSKDVKKLYGESYEVNEGEIKFYLTKFINENNLPLNFIKKFKVIVVGDKKFGEFAHDRFFRMGKYIWDIGCGLEIFQGDYQEGCEKIRVDKNHSASFKSFPLLVRDYKDIEDNLLKHRRFEIDIWRQ